LNLYHEEDFRGFVFQEGDSRDLMYFPMQEGRRGGRRQYHAEKKLYEG